jgi:ribosomal peptide maturation radical SAM protein 1
MATSRVLIVNMPFSNLRWPNLGPSLLKAALVRRGIGCDMAYLNFDFAERVGLEHYDWLADHFAFVLGGERLFAKHYFPKKGSELFSATRGNERRAAAGPSEQIVLTPFCDDESYFRDVLLSADADLSEDDFRDYQATEQHIAPFLDACTTAVDFFRYGVVGFATTFQQTMPSVCLARRIKQLRPEVKIAFGGAACEGPMGIELARMFPEIDYVFLGEADLTFPPVVEQILEGKPVTLPPGVVGVARPERSDGRGESSVGSATPLVPQGVPPEPALPPTCCELPFVEHSEACMVYKLDELPYPDFDDYFARLKSSPLAGQIEALLFFETSRGCWWGQKHHCAFCGLNGASLTFRSKSPRRAVDELEWLVERYGVRRGCMSDNILDYRYFDTFLPMLKEAKLGLEFVYEMKTNLTRQQVEKLLGAGLRAAQLGIETFITPVLKLIGKGANALQNLQTLKWFSEPGIEVKWNFLYGFPGENPADYAGLLDLLPSLYHLAPPLAVGRVRLDRFSPYFADPEGWGMANPRPNRAFRYVYPFPQDVLARIAYYYEYDYADGRNPLDYVAPVLEAIDAWQQLHGTVTLRLWDRPDGVLILNDTRPCAAAFQRRLTGLERQIYLHCDTGRTLENLVGAATSSGTHEPVDAAAIQRMLDGWIAERIMVRLDNRYLSLALRAPSGV